MKKTLVVLAASLSMMSMGSVFAQSQSPAQHAAHHEARVEQRIASLHAALKITPQQEQQWNAFADVMRNNADTMSRLYQQDISAKNLSALDNVKRYAQIQQAGADGAQRLVNAFGPLYDSFSPEQKTVADNTFNEHKHAVAKAIGKAQHHHHHKAGAAAPASDAAEQ